MKTLKSTFLFTIAILSGIASFSQGKSKSHGKKGQGAAVNATLNSNRPIVEVSHARYKKTDARANGRAHATANANRHAKANANNNSVFGDNITTASTSGTAKYKTYAERKRKARLKKAKKEKADAKREATHAKAEAKFKKDNSIAKVKNK